MSLISQWPKRYTVISLLLLALLLCYIDRILISLASIEMQQEFGWSDSEKGLVMSTFFVGLPHHAGARWDFVQSLWRTNCLSCGGATVVSRDGAHPTRRIPLIRTLAVCPIHAWVWRRRCLSIPPIT